MTPERRAELKAACETMLRNAIAPQEYSSFRVGEVAALIDALEQAESERDEYRQKFLTIRNGWHSTVGKICDERDEWQTAYRNAVNANREDAQGVCPYVVTSLDGTSYCRLAEGQTNETTPPPRM